MDWIKSHIKTLTTLSGMGEQAARELFLQPVRVELAEHVAPNRTYRLAYVTAVNLVSRIFPRVDFRTMAPAADEITPWGVFEPSHFNGELCSAFLRIGGENRGKDNEVDLVLQNWHVLINSTEKADPAETWNPLLSIIGACYAASAITNKLLNGAVLGAQSWPAFSILDFSSATADFDFEQSIDIGEVHVAGIGAVGSAFLYSMLAHGKCQGKLHVLDKDIIDSTNLGRYPLFDIHDINKKKVVAAKERLGAVRGLDVIPHPVLFQQYCREQLATDRTFRVGGLVSAPDNRETRRQFQHELPRQVWDASTGPDQIVIHQNNYAPEFACMECIYPERPEEDAHSKHVADSLGVALEKIKSGTEIDEESAQVIAGRYPQLRAEDLIGRDYDSIFRDLCSASSLRAGDEVVLAPMSFISVMAGGYQYLEFLKSLRPDKFNHRSLVNYYTANPHFPPNPYLRELRGSRLTCSCQSPAFRRSFNRIWNLG
jgi:hypothetical protein